MYALGVDLGTTFTAGSTWRDGHAEIASLGSRAAVIPSVVLLREDETVLTGEAASRRGMSEPDRVAREFKRRLGDTTPILLGGVPYSAEALMARMLRSVVDAVAAREGSPPSAVCVSHPANWGPYKTDLLHQAVRLAGLEQPVTYTTEPEAAAAFYAHQQRIQPGALVAVYDLGGGTFDAAILRKTATGFEILGQPEGIERLGGIDIDAAVFGHVSRALGGKLQELDEDDPVAIAAVSRLREECIQAKEALSSDTDVAIAVLLPNISTEVRLTRAELEAMVRPVLHSTVEALKRALRSAGVTPEQLHSVLLVGGSSRMPIVAQLVGAELGRPVAVDAHPKHAVALGAAWLASDTMQRSQAGRGVATVVMPPAAAAGAAAAAAAAAGPGIMPGTAGPPNAAPTPAAAAQGPPAAPAPAAVQVSPGPMAGGPPTGQYPNTYGTPRPQRPSSRRRTTLIAAGAALAVLLTTGAIAWVLRDNSKTPTDSTAGSGSSANLIPTASPTPSAAASSSAPPATSGGGSVPADERCTDELKANVKWVCLTKATFDGTKLTIEWEAEWHGVKPNVNGGYHLHIYGGDGVTPADSTMGLHSKNPGKWYLEDKNPSIRTASSTDYVRAIGDMPKVCARIADKQHRLYPDAKGTYQTGNCLTIQRTG